ncbi:flavin reductase (DIM6/NTAB) family NADH-FMN oxidoreductase RutF [Methylopila capsulata]|uniref:Flavin reductase n=1 Tax=Methylopila capsulata TaxID=61654 RepID=A0A9W6MSU6_9HYPH|nr:flavin reductase family protein [Methylopila capsulata]MBM7852205.1 flavin reductase (DIM6/NTAB) family NADH-FMN oxidoreductase RutF [Methylopila capsulata]GLK56411.1 flavin reductase [Methylopila capsulata]
MSASAITATDLRTFAGQFATGVAVVTTKSSEGELAGVTINAVTSLSLTPPLFLICLDHKSNTLGAVLSSGKFAIHFLAKGQTEVSRVFASKSADKFAEVDYVAGENGSPIISGVLAAAECSLAEMCLGGDHTIIIGQVEKVHIHGGEPLLYHRGAYAALDERVAA